MYIPQICLYGAFLFVFSHHDHTVLVNKKSNAMLVFILFSTEETLCPSSVVVSPKFFYLISQSLRMFQLYLSISCVSF